MLSNKIFEASNNQSLATNNLSSKYLSSAISVIILPTSKGLSLFKAKFFLWLITDNANKLLNGFSGKSISNSLLLPFCPL